MCKGFLCNFGFKIYGSFSQKMAMSLLSKEETFSFGLEDDGIKCTFLKAAAAYFAPHNCYLAIHIFPS